MTDPKLIVSDFLTTFSAGDIEGMLDRMTDDATWSVTGTVEGHAGAHTKSGLAAILKEISPLYRGGVLIIRPTSMLSEGNRVAAEAEGYAELVNGRIYANRYHFLFEMRGDQIASIREYSDTLHMSQTFAPDPFDP